MAPHSGGASNRQANNARKTDQSHSDSSNSFIRQGSNDSNYSGPSSGGDLSFEENDKNHITSKASAAGIGAGGGLGGGIGGATGGRSQQQQQKGNQSKQQRSQDAKQEIELCRVSYSSSKSVCRFVYLSIRKLLSAELIDLIY